MSALDITNHRILSGKETLEDFQKEIFGVIAFLSEIISDVFNRQSANELELIIFNQRLLWIFESSHPSGIWSSRCRDLLTGITYIREKGNSGREDAHEKIDMLSIIEIFGSLLAMMKAMIKQFPKTRKYIECLLEANQYRNQFRKPKE